MVEEKKATIAYTARTGQRHETLVPEDQVDSWVEYLLGLPEVLEQTIEIIRKEEKKNEQ